MKKEHKFPLFTACSVAVVLIALTFLRISPITVLEPKGWVAEQQKNLMFSTAGLMLIVVIPVLILAYVIAWKYRAENKKARYEPNWDKSILLEAIWWGIPCIIIVLLSIFTWEYSHRLDPFKPLESDKKPITIQVVALQWKWLFLYPEYKIATVNAVHFPEKTPIHFEITADAPMNSFWIPSMGSQIYAMPGMKSQLHLIANEPGQFKGSSANLSGVGFSGMTFVAVSESEDGFAKWVEVSQQSKNNLTLESYQMLAEPSKNNPIATYALEKEDLYDWIVMKYMMPPNEMRSHQE